MSEPANPNNPFNYGSGWTEIDNGEGKDPTPVSGPLDPTAVEDLPIYSQANDLATAIGEGDIAAISGGIMELAGEVGFLVVDPIGFLVSNGLAFLIDWIQPLEDAFGLVTGNPERLGADAERWKEITTELGNLVKELNEAVNTDLATWSGPAADAARARLAEFAHAIEGVANDVNGIGVILDLSVALMEIAQELILTIIAEFVTWLVITWLAALAAAAPTFGGSTAAAGAATAGEAAVATSRTALALQKITRVMGKLKVVLQRVPLGIQRYSAYMNRMCKKYPGVAGQLALEPRLVKQAPLGMKGIAAGAGADAAGQAGSAVVNAVPGAYDYAKNYQSDEDIEKGLAGL